MMTRTEHLLVLLMEECDETSQRASKALRFGLDEVQEGQPLNNAERICYEFNDILAIVELLKEDGLLTNTIDPLAIALKKEKVEKWLAYSAKCGTIKQL